MTGFALLHVFPNLIQHGFLECEAICPFCAIWIILSRTRYVEDIYVLTSNVCTSILCYIWRILLSFKYCIKNYLFLSVNVAFWLKYNSCISPFLRYVSTCIIRASYISCSALFDFWSISEKCHVLIPFFSGRRNLNSFFMNMACQFCSTSIWCNFYTCSLIVTLWFIAKSVSNNHATFL